MGFERARDEAGATQDGPGGAASALLVVGVLWGSGWGLRSRWPPTPPCEAGALAPLGHGVHGRRAGSSDSLCASNMPSQWSAPGGCYGGFEKSYHRGLVTLRTAPPVSWVGAKGGQLEGGGWATLQPGGEVRIGG